MFTGLFSSSRPDVWTLPRQALSASERFMRFGAIHSIDCRCPECNHGKKR